MNRDPKTLRRILYSDPVWAAYAIADLQPRLAERCRWFVGGVDENVDGRLQTAEVTGLVLLYAGFEPPILFAIGPAAAVAQALAHAEAEGALPPAVYLSIRHEHEAAVGRYYDAGAQGDRREMVRMVLRDPQRVWEREMDGLVRLHVDDAARLERLYAQGGAYTPDAFEPSQLEFGVFYAIEEELPPRRLLGAGGTHIVDWDAGIAAIGNFYTRPDVRRQGMAGALLAAVMLDLRAGHVDTIVLNVDQGNADANRLYERHGFVVHCAFIEGVARRKPAPASP